MATIFFGILQLDNAAIENLPEYSAPVVEVQTEALGLSAVEVEQLITVPLEADLLNGIAFVEDIHSESIPGLSSIVMTFEPGTDILDARQLVQERLTQAAGLPNVSRAPAMVQPLSSESRVMMLGLTSESLSPVELGVLARWTIRPKLMGVDGVANVAVWGQREQQLQVQVDLDTLLEERVPLQDVVNTAGNALWVTPLTFLEASTPGVGGFIDGPNQRIGIRHVPAISRPEDLATVVIDGRPDLVIGDLATVVEDHQPLIGDAIVDGQAGLYLVVEKFPWSSTGGTTAAVEAALAELEPGLAGVQIESDVFRPANYLERAVDNIQLSAIIGLLLVAAVILVFTGSWRAALAAIISLLVAVVAAATVLVIADVIVNSMILLGLAIGSLLIIDDSIRNGHEIRRRRGEPSGLVNAVRFNTSSLVFTVVILIVALLPSLWMLGTAGEFVPVVALTMGLAFVVAFVVSITIAPSLAGLLRVDRQGASGVARPMATLERGYAPVLALVGSLPRVAALAGLGLLAVGAALIPALDREFVPEFHQTNLLVTFDAAPGVSLQESRRMAANAARELNNLPGVERAGAQLGRAILSDQITSVDGGVIWLSLDPSADYDATRDSIRETIDGYPGFARPTISTYTNDRVRTELQQPGDDLVVRVYGEDPAQLNTLATEFADSVAAINGVENARALLPLTAPSIEIDVDLDRAAEAQVKPGDARRAAAIAFAGIEVGSLFEDQKVFEVIVWSKPEYRNSISSVENLLIDTPSGRPVPLGSIADIRVAPNERVIERDAVSRYVDVVADVPDRDVSDVQDEITALVNDRGLPYEFHVGFLGNAREAASNLRAVLFVGATAAVIILLILQSALSSWRLAGVTALASLASLSGSALAMAIAGGTYSIGSMAGLVAVAGLTLRAGLGLAQRYEVLQLDGNELGPDLVADGARCQFGPTLVTLMSMAVVTLPFIVFGNDAGREILGPFAISVLGGVVTSAIVTLVVLPGAYQWLARPAAPHEDLVHREAAPPRAASERVAALATD